MTCYMTCPLILLTPLAHLQVGLPLRPRRSSVTVPKSPMLLTKLRAKEVGWRALGYRAQEQVVGRQLTGKGPCRHAQILSV